MIYVGLLTLALLAVLAACVIAWAWFPRVPSRDCATELKQIHAEQDRQIAAHNKFEKEMAMWDTIMPLPGYWQGELNFDDVSEEQIQFLKDKGIERLIKHKTGKGQ